MKIKIGDEVAFNNREDAVWFKVVDIRQFTLVIQEVGDQEFATQTIDRSYVKSVRKKVT